MSSHASRRSRLATGLLAVAAAMALTAGIAAPAGAVSGQGSAVIVAAQHDSGRTLSGQGVKLIVGTPGSAEGNKLTLPIAEVSPAGAQPSAAGSAALTFKRGKESMTFTDLRFDLAAGTLVGRFDGAQVPIFRVEGAPQVNSGVGSVALSGAKLRLVSDTANAIKSELELERSLLRTGVGMAWLSAKANPIQITRTITSGGLEWGFLTSWREYIYKELGPKTVGTITTEGGATISGEVAKPGSTFTFPAAGGSFREGLYGASTTVALNTQGSVKFAKPGHCIIEIKFSDLQANIDGANSSIVGNLTYDIDKFTGKACEDQPPVSAPGTTIATLDASGVVPSHSGNTTTWAGIPATLTAAAATPFAPMYKEGQPLDPVTIAVGVG